jgi:hypothetical protein
MCIGLSNLKNIVLGILLAILPPYTLASEMEILSFNPIKKCKISPTAPPANLLERTYKIYNNLEAWKILDINGDSWCDWVRGGYEGSREDQDGPPMRDFIYLGTPNGWREIAQSGAYKDILKRKNRAETKGLMLPYIEAFNFYQPLFIYSSIHSAPYVLTASRPDGPAPYPEVEDIFVMRWDSTYDLLRFVGEVERRQVIAFTKFAVCKSGKTSLNDGRTLIIKDGLCKN